ncbi:hypothetical protein [Streptomyces sp. NPDC002580]|uniref:hypothetical protein n=1 Tax=Streptomyces sp. NPDC002580 TaxID=3364653 RepID=UPI00369FD71C
MLRTRIAKVAAVSSLVVASALAAPVVTLWSAGDAAPASSVLRADAGWQTTPADAGWQVTPADAGWQAAPADAGWQ